MGFSSTRLRPTVVALHPHMRSPASHVDNQVRGCREAMFLCVCHRLLSRQHKSVQDG